MPAALTERAGRCGLAGAVLVLALCGCIALPVPVHQAAKTRGGSRDNVSADSAPQILIGQTTRLDLLLQFGEPDGRGAGDQWFTYRTHRDRAGWHWALVVIGIPPTAGGAPLGNWQRVERLTIRFDERGVVAAVGFEGRNCTGCRNVLSAGEAAGATR